MKRVFCQVCFNKTNQAIKVLTYGWNKELVVPAQIDICPRCRESWTPQTHLHYVDVGDMSKKEAEETIIRVVGKKLAEWW